MKTRRQEGMSLPEVMIASAVFAISLLGLMRYHQALSANFQQYWGQLKAVRYVHNQLEQYERLAGQIDLKKKEEEAAIQRGWKVEVQQEFRSWGCYQVTIKLTVHYNKPSKLERWFCTSGSIDV
ncbi:MULTISPECIES: prepilin-type N-terminal cleavage/methylation domain-containing protein [Xenorhabdus]|uniref:prepilin-type N-terminal cleavage/methylation domain-containing protein n=1 Tax=Xenorhabdus TaxID=626 RepID=UPI0006493215|nr:MULTISPECIES: prepilin-type N-terminal cleavage/methylation domain-containing protein [Xenorhabdus]KLU14435.1 precorrin-2 dehydrogenase [Xenorhabdus griffiniae]KOP33438.1 precorrin-2 dehydrogenase [Xenorhabdus sp. GDc328]